jgi:hypothetical protein
LQAKLDKLTSTDTARRGRPRLPARGRKLIVSAIVTTLLLVALPGAAVAQASSPTSAQYHDQQRLAQQQIHQAATANPDPRFIGTLPFTGDDLAPLAVVALALVGAGIALQRLSKTAKPDERS